MLSGSASMTQIFFSGILGIRKGLGRELVSNKGRAEIYVAGTVAFLS